MIVEIRRSISPDYLAIPTGPPELMRRGVTLEIDGEVWAVGCLYLDPAYKTYVASVGMRPELRKRPKTLHAFAKKAIEIAGQTGIKTFLTIADKTIPRSEAWLEALGFQHLGEAETGKIYRCKVLEVSSLALAPSSAASRKIALRA